MRWRAVAMAVVIATATTACIESPAGLPVTGPARPAADDHQRPRVVANALRVRTLTCSHLQTGSAFAVDERTLVTNRHVVDGAKDITIDTWDGDVIEASVERIARSNDLAVIVTDRDLPVAAELSESDPLPGDELTVVGYPGGRSPRASTGELLAYEHDAEFGLYGSVMRFDADVRPGNSGGPIMGSDHTVVGVVYAVSTVTDDALGIPASAVRRLLADDMASFEPAAACPLTG